MPDNKNENFCLNNNCLQSCRAGQQKPLRSDNRGAGQTTTARQPWLSPCIARFNIKYPTGCSLA